MRTAPRKTFKFKDLSNTSRAWWGVYRHIFSEEAIAEARRAVDYLRAGAQVADVALGQWFDGYRAPDGAWKTSAPVTDAELAAVKAFASKAPSQVSACAEGLIYLGAPSVKGAERAIGALTRIMASVTWWGGIVAINDSGFGGYCPTRRQLVQAFDHGIAIAESVRRAHTRGRKPAGFKEVFH
jgi:hypothetical protein